jgi:adsorption protein B
VLASVSSLLARLDQALAALVAAMLWPLGIPILVSSLDDLAFDFAWIVRLCRRRRPGPPPQPERRIAVFVPLWHEAGVIGAMLDHNLAAIAYSSYEVFVGVYPNDPDTCRTVLAAARRHPKVHLAEVPHDGPTSKADCLNWIYQCMLVEEERRGARFDLIMLHDAEDLIHPKAFARINRYAGSYDMIQLPVLALPTPWHELTHGVYCDDFAESQSKDLVSRVAAGGFLPGCGVGTAFRREVIERLAEAHSNRIFEPGSLTEDYDNGLRLHALGARQIILPVFDEDGEPVATREYFPRNARQAVRQRARWVLGNALQAWERFGWGKDLPRRWVQVWFLWRDRKGLWGNPVSLAANLLMLYGLLSWGVSRWAGAPWSLRSAVGRSDVLEALLAVNAALFLSRVAVRMHVTGRIYGWRHALGVPLRLVLANWINASATIRALRQYIAARVAGRPLRWVKTEHAYPTRAGLAGHKRKLGEILATGGYAAREDIEAALGTQPEGVPCGEHFVALGLITEAELYEALSLQHGLECVTPPESGIPSRLLRALPARVASEWSVLPFRVRAGALEVASPNLPHDVAERALRGFTRLELRFLLMTPSDFRALSRRVG